MSNSKLAGQAAAIPQTVSRLSGLRVPDRFGVYLWWPQDSTDWIHPDDIELCFKLIPSNRIFQRFYQDEIYNRLVYGKQTIRLRPTLWLEVTTDGYLIGDRVEIKSQMGRRRPAIATIEEMLFNRQLDAVEYHLSVNEQILSSAYYFEDIQPAFKLEQPMDQRQRMLTEKSQTFR